MVHHNQMYFTDCYNGLCCPRRKHLAITDPLVSKPQWYMYNVTAWKPQ